MYTESDFSDSIVAFLDILGFRRLAMQEDPTQALESLNTIDAAVGNALRAMEQTHARVFSPKLFSDCMCVSCEYTPHNLFAMLYELGYVQYYLAMSGVFLRGGLARGRHFESERVIFSRGLIAAYDLERTADYPRIVVESGLVAEAAKDGGHYCPIYAGFDTVDFLMRAPDGVFFVDYLNTLWEEGSEHIDEFSAHKESILRAIRANQGRPRVLDKYRWAAEYHNLKFGEFYRPEDWDESHAIEVTARARIDLSALLPQFESAAELQEAGPQDNAQLKR